MEGRSETAGWGIAEERVYIGNNMETCRQDSLRATAYRKIPRVYEEVGPRHKGNLEGEQETVVREGGSVGGDTVGVEPPYPPGSLSQDQGVVQGYS